jgi:hypothetical protein
MTTLDDHIAEMLRESERNGELRSAPSWGKPLALDDGFDDTPVELRLPFKILKEAGLVPPEVELMRQLGGLRQRLAAHDGGEPERQALQQRISELQQLIALRLERLRVTGRV